MSDDQPNAKVLFAVASCDGETNVETLWATALGSDRYRLDNSPFFAYSVSWLDIVHAPYDEAEQFPTFTSVLEKSGNRTVRISFDAPVDEGNSSDGVLQGLVALGCSYEGASRRYIVVNVPPEVDLDRVRDNLNASGVNWEHADPTYAELFQGEV